jgi:hypothetical protein
MITDQDLSRAEALGRLAARAGRDARACPYQVNGDTDQRVLAARFVRAYIGEGSDTANRERG